MNKKELIEKYEGEFPSIGMNNSTTIKFKLLWDDILELDEPQKVKVPPFVSVWYRINKDNLYKNIAYLCANWVKSTTDDTLFNWMSNTDNFIEILVNMHRFGYEVEKEKRYLVKIKGTEQYLEKTGSAIRFSSLFKSAFTRKTLEEANFGWVFDCEGIEIEEVNE